MRLGSTLVAGFILTLAAFPAFADLPQHVPQSGAYGFQPAATEVARQIHIFHNLWLMPIITTIVVIVTALMLYIFIRFNRKANPVPQKFSHNTLVEVVWTLVPVLILVVIAVPSFRLLYLEDVVPESDMTVKAIGSQWYWDYEYTDPAGDPNKTLSYSSVMLEDDAAKAAGKPRLLGVDNPLVVPAGKTIRVIVTANDVIHSFAMPAFGVKIDAVPGRLNETWFKVDEPGIYYGQCSELCGSRHAYMPIEIQVMPQADYDAWFAKTQAEYASYRALDGAKLASTK
jgi:cytochrome c oxidase subunit II